MRQDHLMVLPFLWFMIKIFYLSHKNNVIINLKYEKTTINCIAGIRLC